ncbi:Type 1 glutamine amidotransferase-like domain-containing protein [Halomicrococcus sp. NG-SE-24]|uniref:Type 1 glutamine amidotransferase-like domain-containing protein n=1 Tax=Halomicrococcus sp. NG-SE-24 TaxID=3436928 RepID=UPI003D97B240
MTHIVAIGGGEIAERETERIDRRVVAAADGASPTALFVPTASGDAAGYCERFHRYYGDELGCETTVLRLVDDPDGDDAVERKIAAADLVYVGGGDTGALLDRWRERGVAERLRTAAQDGTLLAGLSAGALCWFDGGLADAVPDAEYGPLDALGWVDGLRFTPHAHAERRRAFADALCGTGATGLALTDRAAVEIRDDEFRILTGGDDAAAYLLVDVGGRVVIERVEATSFRPLDDLGYRFGAD